jgi:hypothetical protein
LGKSEVIVFKVVLVLGLLVVVRTYFVHLRTKWRDRIVILPLVGVLIASIIHPNLTTWAARRVGVGRGADLAFYIGFLLVGFLLALQRARLREQEQAITVLVRELAYLRQLWSGESVATTDRAAGDEPARTGPET